VIPSFGTHSAQATTGCCFVKRTPCWVVISGWRGLVPAVLAGWSRGMLPALRPTGRFGSPVERLALGQSATPHTDPAHLAAADQGPAAAAAFWTTAGLVDHAPGTRRRPVSQFPPPRAVMHGRTSAAVPTSA